MDRFVCPYCGKEQRVSAGFWDIVFAQVLTHFSVCAPPSRYPDTQAMLKEAERITNMIAGDVR